MARKENLVFLGFEDEEIKEETYEPNSKVNKIGGEPDWPNKEHTIEVSACVICGMSRPLILQLYAPLEQSHYHRTFFVFACLRSTCSQDARSWTCLRIQHLETKVVVKENSSKGKQKQQQTGAKINWCNNFDDWGQAESCDDKMLTMCVEEENGNSNANSFTRMLESEEDEDDDDDDGNKIVNDFSQLQIKQNKEPNANCAAGLTLTQKENEAQTFAQIESEETDLVLAEAPIKPRANLRELLTATASSMNFADLTKDLSLKPFYIAVDIEQPLEAYGSLSAEHIQEIYDKYKIQDEDAECFGAAGGGGGAGIEHGETYETALPLHGDLMFHKFLTTIKMNPEQILRYTRDAAPILIEPLIEFALKCKHCNGPTICEIQILPTLIPKLKFKATNQNAPIDFGNVLIFTCQKSCWDTSDKMRYEIVIVQKEK